MTYEIIRKVENHPIPFDQEEINEIWEDCNDPALEEPPHLDTAHEEYTRTIADTGNWHVFRVRYPFAGSGVYIWNKMNGECLKVPDTEGEWHNLVNLFAEIVDEEGDCRDAEYSGGTMPSGAYNQRCNKCGSSWSI